MFEESIIQWLIGLLLPCPFVEHWLYGRPLQGIDWPLTCIMGGSRCGGWFYSAGVIEAELSFLTLPLGSCSVHYSAALCPVSEAPCIHDVIESFFVAAFWIWSVGGQQAVGKRYGSICFQNSLPIRLGISSWQYFSIYNIACQGFPVPRLFIKWEINLFLNK